MDQEEKKMEPAQVDQEKMEPAQDDQDKMEPAQEGQEKMEQMLMEEEEKEYALLDDAIEYKLKGYYPDGLTENQKRSVRRKANTISVEHDEVFIMKKKRKV